LAWFITKIFILNPQQVQVDSIDRLGFLCLSLFLFLAAWLHPCFVSLLFSIQNAKDQDHRRGQSFFFFGSGFFSPRRNFIPAPGEFQFHAVCGRAIASPPRFIFLCPWLV
jgi:hypothetical protein